MATDYGYLDILDLMRRPEYHKVTLTRAKVDAETGKTYLLP
jgi:hypothetical protein